MLTHFSSKEKLIKYRNLYFQATGQDPNQRPAFSNSASQPLDPRASASSKIRESIGNFVFLTNTDIFFSRLNF